MNVFGQVISSYRTSNLKLRRTRSQRSNTPQQTRSTLVWPEYPKCGQPCEGPAPRERSDERKFFMERGKYVFVRNFGLAGVILFAGVSILRITVYGQDGNDKNDTTANALRLVDSGRTIFRFDTF